MGRIMKDSGLPWIGMIPSSWRCLRGKYALQYLQKPTKESDGVITCFRDGEVTLRSNRREEGFTISEKEIGYQGIDVGDLVVHGMDGFAGAIGISDSRGKASPVLVVLDSAENKRFLMYYLRNLAYRDVFLALATGIRVRSCDLRWNKIADTVFVLPPIEEQNAIVTYIDEKLSEIDAAIKEAQELIEKYKEYKLSKVKEIFDFYLKNESYVIAKLGSLASLVTKQTGFDYSNTISPSLVGELTEDTLPYIQTRHFKDNYWNYETEYYIPINVARLFPRIILDKRCLLFSIVGASIGNVAVYPGEVKAFLGGAICKVNLYEEAYYDYIKHYMMSCYGQEQISFNIKASAQGTITVQNVRDFKIPIFKDRTIQDRISSEADKIASKIYALIKDSENLISQLHEYKKSIIFEYVTGKKEVPNG